MIFSRPLYFLSLIYPMGVISIWHHTPIAFYLWAAIALTFSVVAFLSARYSRSFMIGIINNAESTHRSVRDAERSLRMSSYRHAFGSVLGLVYLIALLQNEQAAYSVGYIALAVVVISAHLSFQFQTSSRFSEFSKGIK